MSNQPSPINTSNVAVYTPAEAVELATRAGMKKGNMRADKVFLSAVSAGCLLNFGSATMLMTIAAPWFSENAPGILKMIGALVFPFGFIAVMLTGVDLFTASTMFTMLPTLQRRLPVWKMFLHWLLCFWGNLAGSLFLMAVIFGYGGVFDAEPFKSTIITFITHKQVEPQFYQVFLRAIGCNWLVCLACYMSYAAQDVTSKILAMWWPIFGFVCLGLDHVIANMFLIPMGIFLHTPGLTVGMYVWKGIIPALLGNILGGGLFCGTFYWWMYIFTEASTGADVKTHQLHAPETLTGFLHFKKRNIRTTDEESQSQ